MKRQQLMSYMFADKHNKVQIYMGMNYCPPCEKYLSEITDYISQREDVIGKLMRIDTRNEQFIYKHLQEISGQTFPKFPIMVFNGEFVDYSHKSPVEALSEVLPVMEEADSATKINSRDGINVF